MNYEIKFLLIRKKEKVGLPIFDAFFNPFFRCFFSSGFNKIKFYSTEVSLVKFHCNALLSFQFYISMAVGRVSRKPNLRVGAKNVNHE
jgi:hypothetical protein